MSRSFIVKAGVIILGAALGYAYYHFVGCRTGTCPITSNPWISTGYGAFFGFVLMLGRGKKKNNAKQEKQ